MDWLDDFDYKDDCEHLDWWEKVLRWYKRRKNKRRR